MLLSRCPKRMPRGHVVISGGTPEATQSCFRCEEHALAPPSICNDTSDQRKFLQHHPLASSSSLNQPTKHPKAPRHSSSMRPCILCARAARPRSLSTLRLTWPPGVNRVQHWHVPCRRTCPSLASDPIRQHKRRSRLRRSFWQIPRNKTSPQTTLTCTFAYSQT